MDDNLKLFHWCLSRPSDAKCTFDEHLQHLVLEMNSFSACKTIEKWKNWYFCPRGGGSVSKSRLAS